MGFRRHGNRPIDKVKHEQEILHPTVRLLVVERNVRELVQRVQNHKIMCKNSRELVYLSDHQSHFRFIVRGTNHSQMNPQRPRRGVSILQLLADVDQGRTEITSVSNPGKETGKLERPFLGNRYSQTAFAVGDALVDIVLRLQQRVRLVMAVHIA
jgi:PP-loop superfamily ATP-utilizing enzyme